MATLSREGVHSPRGVHSSGGGIWFGTKHIFGYPADYPDTLYRFADFNAGWYASRNAAFQAAVSRVSGKPLALDGDLIRYDSDLPGKTRLAVHSIASRVSMSKQAIHQSLEAGDSSDFAKSDLYHRVFAGRQTGRDTATPRHLARYPAKEPQDHPQPHHRLVLPSGWMTGNNPAYGRWRQLSDEGVWSVRNITASLP